jgi:glycine/D-amino acid oxidase-like deaminating enzyme
VLFFFFFFFSFWFIFFVFFFFLFVNVVEFYVEIVIDHVCNFPYFHRQAVEDMLHKAESELGVEIINEHAEELICDGDCKSVARVRTDTGRLLEGFDHIVVAAGSRTPRLLRHLAAFLTPLALPIVHYKPREKDVELLRKIPVWATGIRQTGYYGFPLHPHSGYCKVGFHGQGWVFPPGDVDYSALTALHSLVKLSIEQRFRDFLRTALPALADATHVKSKLCLYCDSRDSDFVVDRDTEFANVTVVSGGSGHGFKFLPVIGPLCANVVDGSKPHAKLAEAQLRFGRLAERMNLRNPSLDACRSTAAVSTERDAQVREAIRQAHALQARSKQPSPLNTSGSTTKL